MSDSTPTDLDVYRFGPYKIDGFARRLERAGEAIQVTPKVFELLLYLVRNAGRAVPRRELLETIWKDTFVEPGNLDWNVSALRRALAELPDAVETVRGFGYRFAAPVERERPPAKPAVRMEPPPEIERAPTAAVPRELSVEQVAAGQPAVSEPNGGARAGDAPTTRAAGGGRWRWGALLVLASVAALGWLTLRPLPRGGAVAAVDGDPDKPTVVVLPPKNLAERADSAWLGGALRELLGSEVALGENVTMVPGDALARLRSGPPMPTGVGASREILDRLHAELGADLVVSGTYLVLGEGKSLRIDLQLQDARTGSTRLALSDGGSMNDLLALVGRSGAALREELSAGIDPLAEPAASGAAYPADASAIRLYAEGLEQQREFRPFAARERFERALMASPDFALARMALADVLGELGEQRRALEESRRALGLARALPREQRLLVEERGHELASEWTEAVRDGRELVRLFPGSLDHGLRLARAESRSGDHAAARATLDRLASLPRPKREDPRIELERGWAARYAGDFVAMGEAGRRATESGRKRGDALLIAEALVLVSWADLSLDRHREGLAACEEGGRLAESLGHELLAVRHLTLCGWQRADLGDPTGAEAAFRESARRARARGDLWQLGTALNGEAQMAAAAGRVADAQLATREALAVAREAGDAEAEANSLHLLARFARYRGDLVGAERHATEGLELARRINVASRIANQLEELGLTRSLRGDSPGARAALEEAIRLHPPTGPTRLARREESLVLAHLAAGDCAAARVVAERAAGRLGASPPEHTDRRVAELYLAATIACAGRDEPAEALLDRVSSWLESYSPLPAAAELRLVWSAALARRGRSGEAEALLVELSERDDLSEYELYRALAGLRLAELRAARGGGTLELERARDAAAALGIAGSRGE